MVLLGTQGRTLDSFLKLPQYYLASSENKLIQLKLEKGFDFTYNPISDGYILKQVVLQQKGIKMMRKFRP